MSYGGLGAEESSSAAEVSERASRLGIAIASIMCWVMSAVVQLIVIALTLEFCDVFRPGSRRETVCDIAHPGGLLVIRLVPRVVFIAGGGCHDSALPRRLGVLRDDGDRRGGSDGRDAADRRLTGSSTVTVIVTPARPSDLTRASRASRASLPAGGRRKATDSSPEEDPYRAHGQRREQCQNHRQKNLPGRC